MGVERGADGFGERVEGVGLLHKADVLVAAQLIRDVVHAVTTRDDDRQPGALRDQMFREIAPVHAAGHHHVRKHEVNFRRVLAPDFNGLGPGASLQMAVAETFQDLQGTTSKTKCPLWALMGTHKKITIINI